jgi:hypothetical protein
MLAKEFTAMVIRVIAITCSVVAFLGLVFQATGAELRRDPIAFSTVVESRQTWLGGWGVLPIMCIFIYFGILYIALLNVSKQLETSVMLLRVDLGAILLRISPVVEGVKSFIPPQ